MQSLTRWVHSGRGLRRRSFLGLWLVTVALAGALIHPTPAAAQNATLGGTVLDALGALIPGVEITARNTQTGIVNNTISNEVGVYNFVSLQPGIYAVSAELPGFQTQTNTITLGGGQQVRLNFTMQVGGVDTVIEVSVAADSLLATSSASVGNVLPEQRVRDLPTAGRDVLELLRTTGGTQSSGSFEGNFAGQRLSAVNTTRDGIVVSDGRYENGAFSATYTSSDLVEEVRVITSPADAETSRGSGQVQMVTRSGTNDFRGSLFWTNRNSVLDANSWFNNFNSVDKNYENRNQFGGRIGGPIIRNRTFFFFLFEGQRYLGKESAVGTVWTETARQGIFRYFPGANNANATSNNATVDLQGNPVRPANATGDLRSFNVFGPDPLRQTPDNSLFMQELLRRMPAPNDFTTGDGLNTAGHRWLRRIDGFDLANGNGTDVNRDQYNIRLDHNFNSNHKLSLIGTKEKTWGFAGQAGVAAWPTAYSGIAIKRPDVYGLTLTSTLSPNLVNEFRVGRRRTLNWQYTPVDRADDIGAEAFSYLPQSNGIPFNPVMIGLGGAFLHKGGFGGYRGALNPMHSIGNSLSYTRGEHVFKGGLEFRLSESNGFNSPHYLPFANIDAGAFSVTGITAANFTGLTGTNQTAAQNLLLNLSGSVGTVNQGFGIKDSHDLTFYGYPDIKVNERHWHQNEFSAFFKDDWKITPNLTLNVGVNYEWYGAPWEEYGRAAFPVGGVAGLCGISCGELTRVEFVGKNSPNPDKKTNRDDWNNFAPAIGFSYSVPWLDTPTVVRGGYGVAYLGAVRNFINVDSTAGSLPGVFHGSGGTGTEYTLPTYTTLSNLQLPAPIQFEPLLPVPLTDRSANLSIYDRVSPYIQNWNLEVQRELAQNLTMEVRYIGSKSTKLWDNVQLNRVDVFNTGILDAFNVTRAGGNAELFNQMLRGINIGGGASTVNGVTVTGSQALRANSTTRGHLANGNVGALAAFLNTSAAGTGEPGGLLRTNGFPENFIVMNPQFNGVSIQGNPSNSTYHSLQVSLTKRLSAGFTSQTVYTWSRALGDDGELDFRNRQLNKTLLPFHRTHDLVSSGTFELPFGPGRPLLSDAPGFVQRIVERWQLGGILNIGSGAPLSITSGRSTISNGGTQPADMVGDFPKNLGSVTRVDNGVVYFEGLQQVPDPRRLELTTLQGVQGASANQAIADASGNVLLVNPRPGTVGNMGQNWIEGPGSIELDLNLVKRIRIQESTEFELRLDAINVLNRPNFGNPNVDINSNNFGRITAATGSRQFVINTRLNF